MQKKRVEAEQNKRKIGAAYEQQAVLFLQRHGLEILTVNFCCRYGEIDIIARDGAYLVFVEVKYRHNLQGGTPEEAVTTAKQHHIIQAARNYLWQQHYSEQTPCRFDVIGICGSRIRWLRNAFEC